jgi:hypothetical protein
MKASRVRGLMALLATSFLAATGNAQYVPYGQSGDGQAGNAYRPGQYVLHGPDQSAGQTAAAQGQPSLLSHAPSQHPAENPAAQAPLPAKENYDSMIESSWWGKNVGPDGEGCNLCGLDGCYSPVCGNWFGGAYGLIMTRDWENNVWFSYDTNDIRRRVLTSRDADMGWEGGFETRLGKYFNCGQNAFEAVYWGVFPCLPEANVYAADMAGDLNTILHFDDLDYDPGTGAQPVSTFFFQAETHRLVRSYQFHNVELNVLGNCNGCDTGCRKFRMGWAAGVRYFRFDEGLDYASDVVDTQFNGDPEEVHYNIDVLNQLIGFQVGGRVDYSPWGCFSTFVDSKVGLYGNHIKHRQSLGGSNGFAFVSDPLDPFFNTPIDINTSKDDVAMIAELSMGGSYQVTRAVSITGGYRAVALTGVALSTNQIPVDYIAAIDSLRAVDSNGSLILHGAYAGLEFNY